MKFLLYCCFATLLAACGSEEVTGVGVTADPDGGNDIRIYVLAYSSDVIFYDTFEALVVVSGDYNTIVLEDTPSEIHFDGYYNTVYSPSGSVEVDDNTGTNEVVYN